jgi:hypothetical protein
MTSEQLYQDGLSRLQYREPTLLEKNRVGALIGFAPGSFDKRFVRGIHAQLDAPFGIPWKITDKQARCLERLCWKYRVQLAGLGYVEGGVIPEAKPA